jgi:glycosyltransferase involved in cell wall biosynthesis
MPALDRAPRALGIVGDESGCSMWRVWQPFNELQRRGFVAEWCHKDDSMKVLPLVAAGRYDIIVTPRIVWPVKDIGDQWLNAIHKAGLLWAYEVDDNVFSPLIVDRQARLFESEAKKGREQLEWERNERIRLVRQADCVTVTTRRLATVIRSYVGAETPVYVVPNAIDVKFFRSLIRGTGRAPGLENRLTIGWSGGTREDLDILPLCDAWAEIARRHPEVMFVIQGHIPQVLVDAVPAEQRATLPWVPLQEYPRAYVNYDIGCCIVAPTTFNTSKSAIKWYEFTLGGAACVVSKTVYGKEATHGVDALIATTTDDWIEHLETLVVSEAARSDILSAARRTVCTEHSLENNVLAWPTAWSDAIDRVRSKPSLVIAHA